MVTCLDSIYFALNGYKIHHPKALFKIGIGVAIITTYWLVFFVGNGLGGES